MKESNKGYFYSLNDTTSYHNSPLRSLSTHYEKLILVLYFFCDSVIKLQRKQTPRKSRKRLHLPLCPPVQGTSQVCRSLSMRGYDHMTSCDWLLHTLHVYGCRVSRIVKPGNVKDTHEYVWSHICCYLLFYFFCISYWRRLMSIHIVFLIRIERNVYFICEKMFYLPPLQSFFEIFHCFYLFMQYFYLDKNEIKLLYRLRYQTFLGTSLFLFYLKCVIISFTGLCEKIHHH